MLDRAAQRYGKTPAELLRLSPPELTLVLHCAAIGRKQDAKEQQAAVAGLFGGRRG